MNINIIIMINTGLKATNNISFLRRFIPPPPDLSQDKLETKGKFLSNKISKIVLEFGYY